MAGVEAHAHQRGVQGIEDGVDLGRRLAVAARVEVEHRVEAALPADLTRPMDIVHERPEARRRQGGLRMAGHLPGPAHPLGLERSVGEDRLGHDRIRTSLGEQLEDADHPVAVLSGMLGAAEALRQEGTDERQSSRRRGARFSSPPVPR